MKLPDSYYLKKRAQYLVSRLSNGRIVLYERQHHGISDQLDLFQRCPVPQLILDVGANTGQTALRIRASFPKARIISFEPVTATFRDLVARTSSLDIECHETALGSQTGRAVIYLTPRSVTNSLQKPEDGQIVAEAEIDVITLDDFVDREEIGHIDLLKIDAEGHDIEVIRGAEKTLLRRMISHVLVEVGFTPGDERHPLFDDVRGLLARFDFTPYGFYDQTLEWDGTPRLRFANALFALQPTP